MSATHCGAHQHVLARRLLHEASRRPRPALRPAQASSGAAQAAAAGRPAGRSLSANHAAPRRRQTPRMCPLTHRWAASGWRACA